MEDEYYARAGASRESIEHLPIASRFLSPTPRPETPVTKNGTPNIDGESQETDEDEANDQLGRGFSEGNTPRREGGARSAIAAAVAKLNHPRSPYNTLSQREKRASKEKPPLPFPSRSHQSLPPPPRMNAQGSSASLGRQSLYTSEQRELSYAPTHHTSQTEKSTPSRILKKIRRTTPQPDSLIGDAVPPNQLPEDLRRCLEVLEDGIYNGHVTLSESLRKRYEEQYPLVRSLADVFITNVGFSTFHIYGPELT